MKRIGVYKVTNPKGEIYIGASKDIITRIQKHWTCTAKYYPNTKIGLSYLRYGIENHKYEIIDEFDISLLKQRELYWINFYDSINTGLNIKSAKPLTEIHYEYIEMNEEVMYDRKPKTPTKAILLNTETGIFYFGYKELKHAHPKLGKIDNKVLGYRQNNTSIVLCTDLRWLKNR